MKAHLISLLFEPLATCILIAWGIFLALVVGFAVVVAIRHKGDLYID
jgi:hypothetical protein